MAEPGGAAFEEILRASRERVAKTRAITERIHDLVGRGESKDGRILVECTAEDPLMNLSIDARAMRLGSEELAAQVRSAAREARADLDRQVREITEEVFGGDTNPLDVLKDPTALGSSLSEMQDMFGSTSRQAQSMLDQLRGGLGFRLPSDGPR